VATLGAILSTQDIEKNALSAPTPGATTNDAVVRTITMGTGIVSIGVLVGTALKTGVCVLQSDGTNFYELSRTLGL